MLHQIEPSETPATDAPAPVGAPPAPAEQLREHASLLTHLLSRPERIPARWRAPGFCRQVDLVRAHLRPIRSREMLALSYAREHFHVDPVGAPPMPLGLLRRSATEVAYAQRWLELGGDGDESSWGSIVGS